MRQQSITDVRPFVRRALRALGYAIVASAVVMMVSCAPFAVSGCAVRRDSGGKLIGSVTFTNWSHQRVVGTQVLIHADRGTPGAGNRIFAMTEPLAPGETRTVEGGPTETFSEYDFKDFSNERSGCEIDRLTYADGTSWEQSSPL